MHGNEEWVGLPIREEQSATLLRGAVGGLAAAVVGGVAWGWTVSATDYEIGFLAWGIGLLAGLAVVAASGGQRGLPLQVVAVATGALGILIGKYLSYVAVAKNVVGEEIGPAAAATISVFSTETLGFFREDVSAVFGGYDLLWVGLAVWAAWRVPRPRPVEAAEAAQS